MPWCDGNQDGNEAALEFASDELAGNQNVISPGQTSALYDEVKVLGYFESYVSFARQLRLVGLRPHFEACSSVKGRDYIEIPELTTMPSWQTIRDPSNV